MRAVVMCLAVLVLSGCNGPEKLAVKDTGVLIQRAHYTAEVSVVEVRGGTCAVLTGPRGMGSIDCNWKP